MAKEIMQITECAAARTQMRYDIEVANTYARLLDHGIDIELADLANVGIALSAKTAMTVFQALTCIRARLMGGTPLEQIMEGWE